ncbi:ABC transporter permease [Bacteroidales bacterium OttesenSCG-928-B11]|nr:ABC transporter permease [Bacteroidales bacterium OttesenSCG-928-E04]MDL2308450.1 ABC transporter permease [Bacteroidales bacterium OttesenSCG-928-C03]MDL2311315.1 ABC transporter permease [Bacteroidales bacterium OttesenSCG-928-B11]MDL2326041.1 ABC transporter permease [Bacteroidales bacterium OttesenSCG-928-A14]
MNLGVISEILFSMRRNKTRTILTGFSISWGIFLLIILLSAGNGFKNGVTGNFEGRQSNTITINSGYTSKEYKGYSKWRRIVFDYQDETLLREGFAEIDEVVPVYRNWNNNVIYKKKAITNSLQGVYPERQRFENVKILKGRFINVTDILERRKVSVLADKDVEKLFVDEDPIGKEVKFGEIVYQIVGVYKADGDWRNDAYIPYTTAQQIYNPSKQFSQVNITVRGLDDVESNQQFVERLRASFSRLHDFAPDDYNAVRIWSRLQDYLQTMSILNGITIFLWIIGLGTLIAGIVGVSNIMLITVKERTKEFGIRRAIGAKSGSVIWMVILEALIITTIFGYVGMFLGIGLMEIVNWVLETTGVASNGEMKIFVNPTVNLGVVISATLVMIIAGVLAGYFPARKAVKVKPIEALRYE